MVGRDVSNLVSLQGSPFGAELAIGHLMEVAQEDLAVLDVAAHVARCLGSGGSLRRRQPRDPFFAQRRPRLQRRQQLPAYSNPTTKTTPFREVPSTLTSPSPIGYVVAVRSFSPKRCGSGLTHLRT